MNQKTVLTVSQQREELVTSLLGLLTNFAHRQRKYGPKGRLLLRSPEGLELFGLS